ncbi:MAG: undecaprenyldiphospho-muramoylpentapeptide beta-N-acetylglucosaminyltransferase [Bacteroidales bacterium]|nr:undecaprenyldiphospho-muramoylpentapeptide beta-N-acetylglucosaminyltransferase [Bacteroidales bacterium]
MKRRMGKRIIISGGGTGGHVFPAISIADALKGIDRNVIIHFVGANGRLEMTRVPRAGYEISGLPITGFERRISLNNIYLIVKLIKSLNRAKKIISSFKPDVVVGVGGYASGPVLRVAQRKGLPTLIQEQNSYAGMTNKLLAKKARVICVAYEGMEKYFPAEKIRLTGNPVRKDLAGMDDKKLEAYEFFNLDPSAPVVLALGGSGGSLTINDSLAACLPELEKNSVQLIWQTGKYYYEKMQQVHEKSKGRLARLHDFIDRMDLAYAAADIVVSRAGAITISELSMLGLPAILVPSPNVADDHQTKNAMALLRRNAALMLSDNEAGVKLGDTIIELVNDIQKRKNLSENIASMAFNNADRLIAEEILKLAE